MLSLSGLLAFPLILSLADIGPAGSSPPGHVAPRQVGNLPHSREERLPEDQAGDIFFHPLGLALSLGVFPPGFFNSPPTYPTDPGTPPPSGGNPPPSGGNPPPSGGNPPPSGGNPPPSGGDPPPSGGDPPPSGGDPPRSGGQPPVSNAPEPATLLSGLIGVGLAGLYGMRQRRRAK